MTVSGVWKGRRDGAAEGRRRSPDQQAPCREEHWCSSRTQEGPSQGRDTAPVLVPKNTLAFAAGKGDTENSRNRTELIGDWFAFFSVSVFCYFCKNYFTEIKMGDLGIPYTPSSLKCSPRFTIPPQFTWCESCLCFCLEGK